MELFPYSFWSFSKVIVWHDNIKQCYDIIWLSILISVTLLDFIYICFHGLHGYGVKVVV